MSTDRICASESRHDVDVSNLDTAAAVVAEAGDVQLDATEARRIRNKINRNILPLMCIVYWVQFMDKTTLGNSVVLGITKSTHLSADQFNWLGTIFYLAYLVLEYPQNLALQRFPVAKWMGINITIWSIALMCHAACKNFAGLAIVRFILGACEGSTTAGFMLVSSMWYTRDEQTHNVGYWFMMNGTGEIVSGFLSFGMLHIKTEGFEPWQWLMVTTGLITFIAAMAFLFLFPDSPSTAWFLNPDERVKAIQRIKGNQTGLENKTFKREQAIEALKDPKTWLFFLFSALHNIPTSLTHQRQLIISSFGFPGLQTTLLTCGSGVVVISSVLIGINLVTRIPNSRAYLAVAFYIPNILGGLLVSLLPWSNKIGLLFGVLLTSVGTTSFVIGLAWITAVTCGHTKRITTNAIMLIAYCLGNSLGPIMWKQKYKPRNRVPWAVIIACWVCCMAIVLVIRYYLVRENRVRDQEIRNDGDGEVDVYITKVIDGQSVEFKVEKEFLDLTDRQNRDFRYVL